MSACLLGQAVRWDGQDRRESVVADVLARHVTWVPVCPEVELGLGVPREPIQLEGDPAAPRLVGVESRADHTRAMERFARGRVAGLPEDLAGYVLKQGSPSCGAVGVPVRRPGRPAASGAGLFARTLRAGLPLLPVEEEGRLRDPAVCASFVERALAYARWRRATAAGMTRARLVRFHAAHTLLLRAYDPEACRRLARLVSDPRRPLGAAVAAYGAGLMAALGRPATRARHAQVLAFVLARVAPRLGPRERARTAAAIARYRTGRAPLGEPLARLRRHAARVGDADLRAQAYLSPHPLRALTDCR